MVARQWAAGCQSLVEGQIRSLAFLYSSACSDQRLQVARPSITFSAASPSVVNDDPHPDGFPFR